MTEQQIVKETATEASTIVLTKLAADKFRQILKEEGKEGWGLRLDVHGSGCSGFEYVLDYSEKAGPEDQVFVTEGVEVHVNKEALSLLLGTQIDFVEGPQGEGFKISNPNAKKRSCGCCCSC